MTDHIITITPAALKYLSEYLATQHDAVGVRFAVKKSGCSGYRYVTECATQIKDTDELFTISGLKCLLDKTSKPMLQQLTLDYKQLGPGVAHLVYLNPNATNECGCGESFGYIGDEQQESQDD